MRDIVRIILCGDGGVGKTTLLNRFIYGRYSATTELTPGLNIEVVKIDLGERRPIVVVYDLGGQEQFKCIREFFMVKADVVVLVYDRTFIKSFVDLEWWLEALKRKLGNIPIILVENKVDKPSVITYEMIQELTMKYPNIRAFIETSAYLNINVVKLFETAVEIALEKHKIIA